MTAETDLLPLPDTYSAAEVAMRNDGKWVRREDFDWHLSARGKIARANLTELQREVEALRAERDLFRDETIELVRQNGEWQARAERLEDTVRDLTDAKASGPMSGVWRMLAVSHELDCMKARAERLAEACARLIAKWDRQADEHGVRQFTGNDHRLFANELRAALDQETTNG